MWLCALLGVASGLLLRLFSFALAHKYSVGQQRERIAALSLAETDVVQAGG